MTQFARAALSSLWQGVLEADNDTFFSELPALGFTVSHVANTAVLGSAATPLIVFTCERSSVEVPTATIGICGQNKNRRGTFGLR